MHASSYGTLVLSADHVCVIKKSLFPLLSTALRDQKRKMHHHLSSLYNFGGTLFQVMGAYGYSIEHILMVDIIPDSSVRRAMNEINAGMYHLLCLSTLLFFTHIIISMQIYL